MNLLKISTCALCLGTVLGVSSMAMEQNGEKCQQGVSGQVQILETSREKEEKSDRYLKFYNDLMTKGKLKEEDARKQAEIFEEELNRGKSFIYAQYYSMLRNMRKLDPEKATLQAKLFEEKFEIDKNFRRADYYATIMISCNLKAVKFARLERKVRSYKAEKKLPEDTLKIIKKDIESNRSYFYIKRYVRQLGKGRGELVARRDAENLEKELMDGKSLDYARAYADLRFMKQSEENSRRGAEIVEKETLDGKSADDLITCLSLIFNKQSEEDAIKGAEMLKKIIKI